MDTNRFNCEKNPILTGRNRKSTKVIESKEFDRK